MNIRIFDVAHGFCACVVADNGNTMLLDCGHNDEAGFYPSDYLLRWGCTGIESFFSLNYDEDHLDGLPRLRQQVARIPITLLYRNRSISPEQLRALKAQSGPLGLGMTALLDMIESYADLTPEVSLPEYPDLQFELFYNNYPEFTDTNNLSVVVFLRYPGMSIIFPGDLATAGWQRLLNNQAFCENLASVKIFVASHHGRQDGYEQAVFQHCKPDIVIISDEAKQYSTQDTRYAQHAIGVAWDVGPARKVLTTRKDGTISITAVGGNPYQITTER